MSNNNEYQNGYHLQHITQVAFVDQFDASHGLYGELIDPDIVVKGLQMSDHVGRLDDPTAAVASQAMHSFLCNDDRQEIVIEFDNTTCHEIVIRWLDEKGVCYPHFQFTVEAFAQQVRYSRLGHLFVLSARVGDEEQLLGAYRIRMPLPSGSPHYLLIEVDPTVKEAASVAFHMEFVLNNPKDEIVVASAALDPVGSGPKQTALIKTIQTLTTILNNIQKDPDNPKYRSLRLANPQVQKTILSCLGARQLLHSVGFREQDEQLVLSADLSTPNDTTTSRIPQALELLQLLATRCQPGFVAELAARPPWQGPVLNSTTTNARAFGSGNGTSFLSDDEKWARAERNRGRRGGGRRRPEPGNAPSSNGRWGR